MTPNNMENKPNPDQIQLIAADKIIESPFEPQARRREKFKTKQGTQAIKELGDSIIANGLQQPILVRPSAARQDFFEIVFGERRFLAHLLKGIVDIPCFVKTLSDAEVIELQYIENHNRQEPDPLDDAFTFHYLQTEKGYTVEDLAVKFAMDKSSVRRRLKLNDLVPEAKELLSGGTLPLGHAVFMAALPEAAQKEIIENDLIYHYQDDDYKIASLSQFKEEVAEEVIRDLSKAPFDTLDTRLHIKQLTCPNCTQRTGFEPKLFDEDFAKGDKCLNKKCFELKSNVHLKLKLEEIAEKIPQPIPDDSSANEGTEKAFEKKVASVPLVTERSSVEKSEIPFKGKVLTNQTLLDEPGCEFSEIGLAVKSAKQGQVVWTCQNEKCPIHHPENIPAEDEKNGPSDYELRRLENNYQIKVAMTVREKVLAKSTEHFNGSNSFWQYADLIEKLLVEIVLLRWSYLKELESVFTGWKNFPKQFDRESVEKFVGELDSRRRDQLLFLCAFAAEGFMLPGGEYNKSQTEIEKLAKSYAKVDYDRLDADVRVELAPVEFKAEAENYRDEFQKTPTVIPRFWWFDFELPD